jgi:hypothetical protein
MNVQQRNLLLLAGLAAAAATPALGQDVAPAVGSTDSRAQSAASIPDLSGIWGRNWFAFEPPSSGPGPVVSKLRRPDGTLILIPVVGDYSNPILRPQAAEGRFDVVAHDGFASVEVAAQHRTPMRRPRADGARVNWLTEQTADVL